ncbi:FAD-binding oxidoreductase, partial [Calidithermus terrae]|uniref:FAD-binding oxidoreductase n=1 Tax=Calidithermus terrae TaxID=1408545 RepID=UPI0011C3E21E
MGLTGRVVRPGDPGYDAARRNYNERFDVRPALVVFCQSVEDVRNALGFARERGMPLRVRGGWHSYEAFSLVEGGLVLDVSDLHAVRVSPDRRTADVGAGAQLIQLYQRLGQLGLTLPGGTCPTVGIAGLTLGGGFGLTSRRYGLTCDCLEEVELVDAEGRVRIASEFRHPDLFWALRGGGGGNFGVAELAGDAH